MPPRTLHPALAAATVLLSTAPAVAAPPRSAPPRSATPRSAPRRVATDYNIGRFRVGMPIADAELILSDETPADAFPAIRPDVESLGRMCGLYADEAPSMKGTSLMVFAPLSAGEDPTRPITAIAWVGGTYVNKETSNFPLSAGASVASANAMLGAPQKRFRIILPMDRKRPPGDEEARRDLNYQAGYKDTHPAYDSLWAAEHPGDVWTLSEYDRVVGFALGPMPVDPAASPWIVVLGALAIHGPQRRFPIGSDALFGFVHPPSPSASASQSALPSTATAAPADVDSRRPNRLAARGLDLLRRSCGAIVYANHRRPEELAANLGARHARVSSGEGLGVLLDVEDPLFEHLLLLRGPQYDGIDGHESRLHYWTVKLYAHPDLDERALTETAVATGLGAKIESCYLGPGERCLFVARWEPPPPPPPSPPDPQPGASHSLCTLEVSRPRFIDGTRKHLLTLTGWGPERGAGDSSAVEAGR